MKGVTKSLLCGALVICVVAAVFAACENPWMKRITAPLYEKETSGGPGGLPALTGVVSIPETPLVGQTLTANTGSLDGSGTIGYRWGRGDFPAGPFTDISSATVYTLTAADTGKYIAVTVIRAGYGGGISSGSGLGPVTLPGHGDRIVGIISGVSVPFRYISDGSSFQRDSGSANISTITNGYWIGETEVTQELFLAVMGVNPSSFSNNPEDGSADGWNKRPVEQVSWYDAIAFCNKLSIANGKEPVYNVSGISNWATLPYSAIPPSSDGTWNAASMDITKDGYRLPTEMEWMWAAMGAAPNPNTTGYNKAFAGSDGFNSIGDYAWYSSNSDSKTHEVGKKNANELGLYDMSGNVYEWCWDWNSGYPSGLLPNYKGPDAPSTYRTVRGGNWVQNAGAATVAFRVVGFPYARDNAMGFRLAARL